MEKQQLTISPYAIPIQSRYQNINSSTKTNQNKRESSLSVKRQNLRKPTPLQKNFLDKLQESNNNAVMSVEEDNNSRLKQNYKKIRHQSQNFVPTIPIVKNDDSKTVNHEQNFQIQKLYNDNKFKNAKQDFETTSKLEKLIKEMIVQKEQAQLDSLIYNNSSQQDQQQFSQYLDTAIPNSSLSSPHPKSIYSKNSALRESLIFEQTLQAYKQDLMALQDIEKNKQQIEYRIKEREGLLRDLSRRTRGKSSIEGDGNNQKFPNRYEADPSANIPLIGGQMIQVSQPKKIRTKRHNKTLLISTGQSEYLNTIFNNKQSPKNNTIKSIQSKNSEKKYNYQKRRVIINDNYSTLNVSTNDNDQRYKNIEINPRRGQTQLRQRPQAKQSIMIDQPQQSIKIGIRSISSTNRNSRYRNLNYSQIQSYQKNQQKQLSQARMISPIQRIQNFVPNSTKNVRSESVPPIIQKRNCGRTKTQSTQQTKLIEISKNDISVQDQSVSILTSTTPLSIAQSQIYQKFNQRYTPGNFCQDVNLGTISSELEEEQQSTHRNEELQIEQKDNDSPVKDIKLDNKQIKEPEIPRDSVFQTPNNKVLFQQSIVVGNIKIKPDWKLVDSESAGASKTTLSTQRFQGISNPHQKLIFSKAKLISHQYGRFSSDNSFMRLRLTTNNNKLSSHNEGEDSQCKFEDYEKEDHKYTQMASQDSVQIIKEEAQVEEEDSKTSDLVQQQKSIESSPLVNTQYDQNKIRRQTTTNSNQNLLSSLDSKIVQGSLRDLQRSRVTFQNTVKEDNDQIVHSDDEIEIRRGLETSGTKHSDPYEPELLRQSTRSLLGRAHANRKQSETNEQEKEEKLKEDQMINKKNSPKFSEDTIIDQFHIYSKTPESQIKNNKNEDMNKESSCTKITLFTLSTPEASSEITQTSSSYKSDIFSNQGSQEFLSQDKQSRSIIIEKKSPCNSFSYNESNKFFSLQELKEQRQDTIGKKPETSPHKQSIKTFNFQETNSFTQAFDSFTLAKQPNEKLDRYKNMENSISEYLKKEGIVRQNIEDFLKQQNAPKSKLKKLNSIELNLKESPLRRLRTGATTTRHNMNMKQ